MGAGEGAGAAAAPSAVGGTCVDVGAGVVASCVNAVCTNAVVETSSPMMAARVAVRRKKAVFVRMVISCPKFMTVASFIE